MNPKLSLFGIVLIFSNCASVYKSIDPHKSVFTNASKEDGVLFSYRYNVLLETRNKKYSKREQKNRVHVVSVRIANHSDKPVQIGSSLNFYVNEFKAPMLDPIVVHHALKQNPYVYLLYLLLIPVPTSNSKRTTPIEIPAWEYAIGPGLAVTNIAVAVKSNRRFLGELNQFNLAGKIINPGEEVYGLVGFPYIGYDPLYLRIKPE